MRHKYLEDLANSSIFDGLPEEEMYRLYGLLVYYSLVDSAEYMSLQEIEEAEAAYANHPQDG